MDSIPHTYAYTISQKHFLIKYWKDTAIFKIAIIIEFKYDPYKQIIDF